MGPIIAERDGITKVGMEGIEDSFKTGEGKPSPSSNENLKGLTLILILTDFH